MPRSKRSNTGAGGERLQIVIALVVFVGLSGLIFLGNRYSKVLGETVATPTSTPKLSPSPSPTPTKTPTTTPTPTSMLKPTPTPTPASKFSPALSPTPTKTPAYTPTPTPTKIQTPTPAPGSPVGGVATPTSNPKPTPSGIEIANPADISSEPDLGLGLEDQVLNEIDESGSDQFDFGNTDGQLVVNTVEASGAGRKISQKKLKRLTLSLVKDKVESKVEIRAENGAIKLKSNKIEAETKLPITLDKTTDKLLIKTANKTEEIQILPDRADQIIRDSGLENEIKKIEILQSTFPANNGDIVYRFTGAKTGKVLGVLPIRGKVETEVGVETGKIVGVREFFLTRILSQFFK